jgi:hypothetical protein
MSTDRSPEPGRYEIRLQGHLPDRWAAWFDGMSLTTEGDGTTVVSGPIVDQAALHGLLTRVRDTGLALVSVTRVGPGRPAAPTVSAPPFPTPSTVATTTDPIPRSAP